MSDTSAVIVVGGGTMGLSAAYSCARAEKRVLALEQFGFFNEQGSSKGLSRLFRIVYSDVLLCLLARSAYPLWQELERESGETLITKSGVLFYGISEVFSREGNLKECKDVMDRLGIEYEEYDAGQLKERFPALKNVPHSAFGLFQADAGFTHADTTLRALYKLAKGHGACLQDQEPVRGIVPARSDGSVEIQTAKGKYRADRVILAPGGWANSVLRHLDLQVKLTVWQMTYAHYEVDEEKYDYPMWLFFGQPDGKDKNLYYGLPPVSPRGQIKVGGDFTEAVYDSPEDCTFDPDPEMLNLTGRFLDSTFNGVNSRPIDPQTCIYTMTPDLNFVLDFVPGYENIVLFTGGTGQGFKFTPIIGTILSQLVLAGETEYNIRPFSIHRAGILD